ncbi:unnamed protein product, partial [Symbiodinium sp. CCMP2456]
PPRLCHSAGIQQQHSHLPAGISVYRVLLWHRVGDPMHGSSWACYCSFGREVGFTSTWEAERLRYYAGHGDSAQQQASRLFGDDWSCLQLLGNHQCQRPQTNALVSA